MNYITTLLTIQSQLRIYHWQTDSHSAHTALGQAYESLDDLIDTFVEEFMGSKGTIRSEGGFKIQLSNIDEHDVVEFVNKSINYLTVELPKPLESTDTNLLNVRDEMLGTLQRLKYLLKQK
jgi:hypothetical protein